jgi:ABC-type sugar transport system, periplasmic component
MKRFALFAAALALSAWAVCAGESIRVLCYTSPITEAFKSMIADFERESGIKINLETMGEDQLNQRLIVEFTADKGVNIDGIYDPSHAGGAIDAP